MEGFPYVINPPPTPRVVFGSSIPREALPLKGPGVSSFMRAKQGEFDRSPGPIAYAKDYHYMNLEWPSTFGYTAFASVLPRLMVEKPSENPPLGIYKLDVDRCKHKKGSVYVPFGSSAVRLEEPRFLTPPPGSYLYYKPRPELEMYSAFMSQRKVKPAIIVVCAPDNIAKCVKCGSTPHGDYWHNTKTNHDMCAKCMRIQKTKLHGCTTSDKVRLHLRLELQDYKKALYCDFYHNHKGTAAESQYITTKQLRDKIRLENYLYPYFET